MTLPFLSDPPPPARGTILKFMCSDERDTVCVSGVRVVRGPGRHAGLPRRAGREIDRLWAPQLSTEIPHRFAPSATVGESGVFFSFSFTLRASCRRVSRRPCQTRKASGQPFSPGITQRSDPGGRVSECVRRGQGGGRVCVCVCHIQYKVAAFLGEEGKMDRQFDLLLEFLFASRSCTKIVYPKPDQAILLGS